MQAEAVIRNVATSMSGRIADLEVQLAMARAERDAARAELDEARTSEG